MQYPIHSKSIKGRISKGLCVRVILKVLRVKDPSSFCKLFGDRAKNYVFRAKKREKPSKTDLQIDDFL
jgi:hypothetical protein